MGAKDLIGKRKRTPLERRSKVFQWDWQRAVSFNENDDLIEGSRKAIARSRALLAQDVHKPLGYQGNKQALSKQPK
jgi:hypothetical protein